MIWFKLYLELSGTFTVFGLTRELQTALLQQHNPETDIVLDMISLPSLDILAFVIAHESKPGFF